MGQLARQKEFSIYSVLAVAQSVIWMFILPDLCQPLWKMFENISSQHFKEVLLNQTTTLVFLTYGAFVIPVYYIQHPFFEQYKILKNKKWPWLDDTTTRNEFWNLTRKSARLCAFNLLVLVPVATVLKCYLMEAIGMESPSFNNDVDHWPSKVDIMRDNFLITVIHEFLFHSAHKIMHMYPSLYKYHKVHHEYKQNSFQAAQHNHPVDYILSIAAPVVLALTIVQPHSFTQFQWAIYVIFTNLDDHVGYSFPWSPVRWFPFAALTQEHEFHHCVNIGCFSSKLDIFERLFMTNKKFEVWEQKRRMKEEENWESRSVEINKKKH